MENIKNIIYVMMLLVGIILGSCASSNDVVSGHRISKRKYNDGFNLSLNHNNNKKVVKTNPDQLALKKEEVTDVQAEITTVHESRVSEEYMDVSSDIAKIEKTDEAKAEEVKVDFTLKNTNPHRSVVTKHFFDLNSTNALVSTEVKMGVKNAAQSIKQVTKKVKASSSGGEKSLVNLILIILLILLIFALLSKVGGGIGSILSLVLAVLIILLILRYFGII
jgi:preprotein translocase subunit SecF